MKIYTDKDRWGTKHFVVEGKDWKWDPPIKTLIVLILTLIVIVCIIARCSSIVSRDARTTCTKTGMIKMPDGKIVKVNVKKCDCCETYCNVYTTEDKIISASVNNIVIEEVCKVEEED